MHHETLTNLINEPELIKTIQLPRRTILEKLRLKQPPILELKLTGVTMRTMQKAAQLILGYKLEAEDTFELAALNVFQHASIIALVIHNHNSPVPPELENAVLDNFTVNEIKELSHKVYRRLDIENFFVSMGLIRGLAIVKDTPETTASPLLSEIQK